MEVLGQMSLNFNDACFMRIMHTTCTLMHAGVNVARFLHNEGETKSAVGLLQAAR